MGRNRTRPCRSPSRLRAPCLSGTASPGTRGGLRKISRRPSKHSPEVLGAGAVPAQHEGWCQSLGVCVWPSTPKPHRAPEATVRPGPALTTLPLGKDEPPRTTTNATLLVTTGERANSSRAIRKCQR